MKTYFNFFFFNVESFWGAYCSPWGNRNKLTCIWKLYYLKLRVLLNWVLLTFSGQRVSKQVLHSPELFLNTFGTSLTVKFRDFQKYPCEPQLPASLPGKLLCCQGTAGTGTGSQGSSVIWAGSQESSGRAWHSLQSRAGNQSCPAVHGDGEVAQGWPDVPTHSHTGKSNSLLTRGWVTSCERRRIKPGSGRMIIRVAVALLHKIAFNCVKQQRWAGGKRT